MNWQTLSPLIPYLISFMITLAVGFFALQRHKMKGAKAFSVVAFSQALWIIGYVFELISPGIESKLFWDDFQWLGVIGWFFGFLRFSIIYTGWKFKKPKRTWILISIIPIIFMLIVATNRFTQLIRGAVWLVPGESFSVLEYDFTLVVWGFSIISYLFFFGGLLLLIQKFIQSDPLHKKQIGIVILGTAIPLVGTLLTLMEVRLGFNRDYTPFTFAISNLIVLYGLTRYRLFNVLPVARDFVIENMVDAVIVLDAQNQIVDQNPSARKFTKKPTDQIIGLHASEVFSSWPQLVAILQDKAQTHREIILNIDEGFNRRQYKFFVSPLRSPAGFNRGHVIVGRNITDLEIMEDALRDQEEKYRQLVETTQDWVWTIDITGKYSYSNPAVRQLLGYSVDEILGRPFTTFVDADQQDQLWKLFSNAIENKTGWQEVVVRWQHKDGPHRIFQSNAQPRFDSQGEVIGFSGIDRDVTERIEMENALKRSKQDLEQIVEERTQELRQSEEKYRSVVETANEGIFVLTKEKLGFVNPKAIEISGYSRSEVLQLSWTSLLHTDDRDWIEEVVLQALNEGVELPEVGRYRIIDKQGNTKWVESNARRINWEGEPAILGTFTDVTETVVAEQELRNYADQLDILHRIDKAILAAQSVEEISQSTLNFLHKIIPFSCASIGLFDFESGKVIQIGKVPPENPPVEASLSLSDNTAEEKLLELLSQGETLSVDDVFNSRQWKTIKDSLVPGLKMDSLLVAPILVEGELLGRLVIAASKPDAFSTNQVDLVKQVASVLSVALRQARLLEETQNQLEELRVLHELANTGQQVGSVEEWFDSATEIISKSIYTESFTIGLLNENSTHIKLQNSRNNLFAPSVEKPINETRFSEVISTGVPQFTPSEICVPIKVGQEVIGVIAAANDKVGAFDENDERLLATIAGQLAVVIQRLISFEAEQYARRTAETMQAANLALTKTLDLDMVLDTVLIYISQLIPYDSANVMLYEDDKYLVVRSSRGYERWTSESEQSFPAYEVEKFPVFTEIKKSLKSLIVADTSQYSNWIQTREGSHINCWIGIPLVSGGEFIGLLALDHKEPNFYTPEHQKLAELFAVQATIAIQNAGLFEQAVQRAKELEEITKISSALRLLNKQEEMFSVLLNEAIFLFKANTGMVFLVDQSDLKAAAVNGPGGSETNILSHKATKELLWDVVQTGESLFVSEQPIDSRYDESINTLSLLPLKTSEGVIGVVLFAWEDRENLSESNRRLLMAFVEITGNALDRARTLETLEHQVSSRTRDLSILYQVTAVASAHSDLESISEKSLEKILEVVGGNTGTIHLLNQEKNYFSLVSQLGIPNALLNHIKILPVDDPFFGKIVDKNAPLIIMDFKKDERIPKNLLSLECQSFIGLPIRTSGQTRGILSIYLESSQQYTSDNVRLLMMVIDQMGIALERALLQEQAEKAIIIEERQRLARELHDAVTQSLYSLALMADAARKFSDKAMWARSEHFLRMVQSTAKDVLKEMRLLVYELRPTALEREGFVSALRQRLETVEARAGIKTDFIIDQTFTPPIDIQVALYRISQEALNNALKHAQATSVSIDYCSTQDLIALNIIDNGRGFNIEQVGGGIGLKSMRERVEKLGGKFKVTTGLDQGTTVSVILEGDR